MQLRHLIRAMQILWLTNEQKQPLMVVRLRAIDIVERLAWIGAYWINSIKFFFISGDSARA